MAEKQPGKQFASMPVDARARIGKKLRASYDEILSQPVPDRFHELLEQLDRQAAASPEDDPSNPPPSREPGA